MTYILQSVRALSMNQSAHDYDDDDYDPVMHGLPISISHRGIAAAVFVS